MIVLSNYLDLFLCFEIFQLEFIGLLVDGIAGLETTPSSVTTDKAQVAVVELTENIV